MKQRKIIPNGDSSLPPGPGTGKKTGASKPAIPLPSFSNDHVPSAKDPASLVAAEHSSSPPPHEVEAGSKTLRLLNVNLIDSNPLGPREIYTPEMIMERAEDLRDQGQHDPIHVIPNPDIPGRFIIADGWTRVQSCVVHHVLDELLAEIHLNMSLREAAWFGYEQNEGRKQHCDFDRAMYYAKMVADGESPAEVSRRAKVSKTMMSFYKAFAELPEDVIEIVRLNRGKFGATEAYYLSKLNEKCGQRKAVALAAKYAAEEQTVRWLINQVQAYTSPVAHRANAPFKQVRYANGVYKQRGDSFELTITPATDKKEAFAAALEKLLDTVAVQVVAAPESKD